jgi:predicted N-acetyltransferase YhbS
MLVEWGCDEADKVGVEVFVETNRDAVPFYQKFGFDLKLEADMPGNFGYTEYVLVRPARS